MEIKKEAVVEDFFLTQSSLPISRGVSTISEKKTFTLAYTVHEKDPDAKKYLDGTSTEEDVEAYSGEPLVINFSPASGSSLNRKVLESLASLEELDQALVTAPEVPDAVESDLPTPNAETAFIQDPRLESVVIVRHPSSLGTGFFVHPNLVLTNYHVIEGSSLIEIERLDGKKESGRIVAKDIRLDLALVEVDDPGPPVRFSPGLVALGDTVHAIGHPSGLTYTLTQGVVSSIRRLPSSFDPGGPPVLFVQTDVAINPGNSGGPLFLEDEVIAVNTKKLAKIELEGLAFSVHVSEVTNFLREYLEIVK